METDIQSSIWFAVGKKTLDSVPAVISYRQGIVEIKADDGTFFQWPIQSFEKYTMFDNKGFLIKVDGAIYQLIFLDPKTMPSSFTTVGRMQRMAAIRNTDYGKWNGVFVRNKVKMPWFFR